MRRTNPLKRCRHVAYVAKSLVKGEGTSVQVPAFDDFGANPTTLSFRIYHAHNSYLYSNTKTSSLRYITFFVAGEYLFSPYSVFTVVKVEFSDENLEPHKISLNAAMDNKLEDEDLPLAPWY